MGLLVSALGICVLAGWALDITAPKGAMRGLTTKKPNTVAQMLFCGAALALLSRESIGKPIRWVTATMAAAVIVVGVLSLGPDVFGGHLGRDHWLFREVLEAAVASGPARISPITAFCSLVVGGALLMATLPIPRSLRCSAQAGLGHHDIRRWRIRVDRSYVGRVALLFHVELWRHCPAHCGGVHVVG